MTFSERTKNGTISGADRDAVQAAARQIRESEAMSELRSQRWGFDSFTGNSAAMTKLAKLFPSLRDVDACDPFNATALVAWLNSGAAAGSGARHAAMFLLNVWNTELDWKKEAGLKVRAGEGRFNFARAMASWDNEHRKACLAWMEAPFFP